MKILADERMKKLFGAKIGLVFVFFLLSVSMLFLSIKNAGLYILIVALGLLLLLLILDFVYYKKQNEIMNQAVLQIRQYISGDQSARIECEKEGELYRLFHEVNSLVAILNAHAQKEEKSKVFLKNTIADISHQLKTPLAALNIYNGILQGEAENAPTIKEFTDLSEQELDRIETLVQNLLKLTKFDAGTIVLEQREENISNLMYGIEQRFAVRARQEKKELVLSGEDDIAFVCDYDWMTEAVSNIVKNALDHTDEGDCITVLWRQFNSMLQITVKDNGSGIHPEDLPHIFKRFYRSRFSSDTQGVGLGLPLAKMIVGAHGGTIEVDSELGLGTTFTMDFLIPTKL